MTSLVGESLYGFTASGWKRSQSLASQTHPQGGYDPYWSPYVNDRDYIDQLALNGLYYTSIGSIDFAVTKWQRIVELSGAVRNSSRHAYEYPQIRENYHMGLFSILTAALITLAPSRSFDVS